MPSIATPASGYYRTDDNIERDPRTSLFELRARAKADPSRELSLAITSLEQSILWLQVSNGSNE